MRMIRSTLIPDAAASDLLSATALVALPIRVRSSRNATSSSSTMQMITLMIVSIGLSLALRYFYQFLFGPDQLVLPVPPGSTIAFGPVRLRQIDIISVIICICLLYTSPSPRDGLLSR